MCLQQIKKTKKTKRTPSVAESAEYRDETESESETDAEQDWEMLEESISSGYDHVPDEPRKRNEIRYEKVFGKLNFRL